MQLINGQPRISSGGQNDQDKCEIFPLCCVQEL